MNDYWGVERYRFGLILGIGALIAFVTPYPWEVLTGVLAAYIGWMLFKLNQLKQWLSSGQKPEDIPDSDGAWEQIAYLFQKARQDIKRHEADQQAALQRFNEILSVLPDAAVLLDSQHHILWANASAEKLLGIKDPQDRMQRLETLVRNPELHKLLTEHSLEKIQITAPRNRHISLRVNLIPLQGNTFLLNARDISLRLQLQRTRRAFVANASHELKTPLTVLMGYMELFEAEPNLSEQLQFGLQQSREQAQRMQHIIEDMLALSRLENQEDAPSRGQPVKFPQLLHKQIKAMQDTLAEGSHDLRADIDETLDINGIQADLISVVTNLLANAVKHTPIGTQIQVVWRRNDQAEACLSVIDNGTGIPEKHLAHLAERFYRVDAGRSREKGGTGLGLAIVKHAVQAHDGELKIESKPGHTEFRACFPSSRWVLQENAA